jgi:hypothetical protein
MKSTTIKVNWEKVGPELLEALKEMVAEFDERNRVLCEKEPGCGGYRDTGGIVLARDAIAKAEGRA